MNIDFESIRKEFQIESNTVYLAANAITLKPKPVIDAAHATINKLSSGLLPHLEAREMIEETRSEVASFIGANSEEVAFSRNTAEGILWLTQTFPWKDGDEVIISENEYPSLVYPFLALKEKGVQLVFAKQHNRRTIPEAIEKCITKKTKVIAVTWPQFDTGQRCDLKHISTLCKSNDILLLVDPIQAIGSISMDVDKLGIDILCSGVQKGLLSYQGLGIFYCRKKVMDRLNPTHIAWGSIKKKPGLSYDTSAYDHLPLDNSLRFEEGCRNIVGIASLNAGLSFINRIGIDNIEQRVKEISDYLCDRAKDIGCTIVSPRDNNQWSGLVSIIPPKQDPEVLSKELMNKSFVILALNNTLLAGINFYNNKRDIDTLIENIVKSD